MYSFEVAFHEVIGKINLLLMWLYSYIHILLSSLKIFFCGILWLEASLCSMAMLGATFVLPISKYWFSKISCIYSMLLTLEAKSTCTHFIADKMKDVL